MTSLPNIGSQPVVKNQTDTPTHLDKTPSSTAPLPSSLAARITSVGSAHAMTSPLFTVPRSSQPEPQRTAHVSSSPKKHLFGPCAERTPTNQYLFTPRPPSRERSFHPPFRRLDSHEPSPDHSPRAQNRVSPPAHLDALRKTISIGERGAGASFTRSTVASRPYLRHDSYRRIFHGRLYPRVSAAAAPAINSSDLPLLAARHPGPILSPNSAKKKRFEDLLRGLRYNYKLVKKSRFSAKDSFSAPPISNDVTLHSCTAISQDKTGSMAAQCGAGNKPEHLPEAQARPSSPETLRPVIEIPHSDFSPMDIKYINSQGVLLHGLPNTGSPSNAYDPHRSSSL